MALSVSSGGFTFSKVSVGGTWSWKIVANNIQGLGQNYQMIDIQTPYGRLYDVVVGIPSDVVAEMADSIEQLQAQLASAVSLVTATPSSYNITVTEAAATETVAIIPITNTGAFGSFLSVTATPSAPWLTVSPSSLIGIGKNQVAQLTVYIKPSLMLADDSPYNGSVIIQDQNSPSSTTITVAAIVLPRPQIGLSSSTVTLTYDMTLNVLGGAQQVTVTNTGDVGSILNFTVAKLQNQSNWLAFTPSSGGPHDSGESEVITFSLVGGNMPMIPGSYTEIVSVASSNALNSPQYINVTLNVTA